MSLNLNKTNRSNTISIVQIVYGVSRQTAKELLDKLIRNKRIEKILNEDEIAQDNNEQM